MHKDLIIYALGIGSRDLRYVYAPRRGWGAGWCEVERQLSWIPKLMHLQLKRYPKMPQRCWSKLFGKTLFRRFQEICSISSATFWRAQEKDPNFAAFPTFPVDFGLHDYSAMSWNISDDCSCFKLDQIGRDWFWRELPWWGSLLQGHFFWCLAVPFSHPGASTSKDE